MKNLSAIPRLSLFAAYTILITLVVCLAGFTGAEAHVKFNQESRFDEKGKEDGFYRRQSQEDASNAGIYSEKSSKVRDDGLIEQRNFASYLDDIQRDVPLDMFMNRHSENFDESDEFDSDRENDGYGYDDDEYYHFNYKRNDDASEKSDKEGIGNVGSKEKLGSQALTGTKAQNENVQKESKTIEMLNFKEMHPDANHAETQSARPYVSQGQKKSFTPEPRDTLKISDLKENSALGEKIKGGKEEVGGVLPPPSDPKVAEVKQSAKVIESKESLNLKDPKIVEESEKKEKDLGIQDKSSLTSKNLKENVKSAEEKEKMEHDVKSVKLGESAKIIEGMDKISKSKEGETAKITKEDKDNSRLYDRLNSEIMTSNGFSQLNNRVNLVSGDYKDNLEQLRRLGMEEDEKNSGESNENDRNVNLNDYSDELRERKDILKESEYANGYGVINNGEDSYSGMVGDFGRNSEFLGIPLTYSPREFFQKRESWKAKPSLPDPTPQIMYMNGPPKDYRLNIPKSELENTEYHKNFMKSLKRYKIAEEQKNLNGPTSEKNPHSDKLPGEPYQERSKTKRGFMSYGDFENMRRDKGENDHFKFRRNTYTNGDMFARDTRLNSGEDRRKSQFSQQHESQPFDTRQRRKSPNLEYNIKTLNQGPSFGKDFSRFNSMKMKKEIKNKIGDQTEGNAGRQYPYSQVSRDYLSKFGQFNDDKIFKRKAPLWKRREQSGDESRDSDMTGRNKGAPAGYYSNRVKFGQKVANRNDEEQGNEMTKLNGVSQLPSSFERTRNPVEKSWAETKNQNLRHDPSKRYDEKEHSSNPLLLVKKDKNGDRLAKAFTDVNSKSEGDEELSSDQLAKILSKDSDYVILKKKEKNKFQKMTENQGSLDQTNSLMGVDSHKSMLRADPVKSEKTKLAGKHESGQRSDRGLYTRSYHTDDENRKFNSNKLHPSSTKSNLRKTFEKFRDLANLFRDNEQDSADNQRQSSEAKAGGEIVFSEDRMPDPIVISNDADSKLGGFKSKSTNSISSISNNFKTLDQNKKLDTAKEDDIAKNMVTSEVKADSTESSWEPALKNAFPEAKSINAVQKNGNEIIVLDFNQNQLKPEASKAGLGKHLPLPSNTVGSLTVGGFSGSANSLAGMDSAGVFLPGGSLGAFQQKNPLISQGDRQVEVILHEGALPSFLQGDNNNNNNNNDDNNNNNKQVEISKGLGGNSRIAKLGINGQNGPFAIFTGTPNEAQITIPIYPFPTLGQNSPDKKPNPMHSNVKTMTKKNSDFMQQNDIANNVNQLMKDFKELSKLYQTHDNKGAFGPLYSNDVVLPSNSFTEPSSTSDNKLKFLRNLLQSITTNDKTGEGTPETGTYQNDNVELDENAGDTAYQVQDLWTKNNVGYETDPASKRQGKWTSAVGKNSDYSRYQSNQVEYVPEEVKQDISKLLQSEGFKTTEQDEYQDGLWEELSEASDKIQRLRREGADKGELKKTIEDVLSFRERRQSDTEKKLTSDSKTGENNKKLESNVKADDSKSKMTCDKSAASLKDDKNPDGKSDVQEEPQMKEGDNKESHESKRSVTKSDSENHLTDLRPEDEVVNRNKSATQRRKRRHVDRRKRSLDAKNKVSTADIQNEILKNLAEDNYQSVYSSGIRRKLLSIQTDEDADNYNNPKGNDDQLVTCETQLQSVNEPINSGIDPTILTLFDTNNGDKEKRRERRSLSSAFHSNYKREIDLDESMPNDFQNFLVTSLGGFGSQKREVVKKEEALWEGKESSQDNFNQIADSAQGGQDPNEESALEKRDVSKSEKQRRESFRKNNNYFNDESGKEISRIKSGDSHSRKKARSQDNSKTSEFADDKNPTHIRIQVTNVSTKEKKSSKPIMDESENTSTEMENLPKEKEFLDKNKVRVNKAQKMYPLREPKFESSNSVRLEGDNPSDGRQQNVYYNIHPNHRRKKKKYVDENAMKPIRNFMTFDQKAMESLLKRYFSDQSSYSITTQKMPVGSHLPQVETVYNPAQGANKAQLDNYQASSIKERSKTSANSKNNLESNTAFSYDAEALRSYLQDKSGKAKSQKENVKFYVDADWKPLNGKSRIGLNSDQDMQVDIRMPNMKTYGSDLTSPSPTVGGYSSQAYDTNNPLMWTQNGGNYINRKPSVHTFSSNALYDAIKLKQEMQPHNNFYRDGSISKTLPKPPSGIENVYNKRDDSTPNNIYYNQSPGEVAWNHDYFFNKNPVPQKYKAKDSFGNKARSMSKQKFFDSILKLKSSDPGKQLGIAPQQLYTFDNGRDFDYLDALEDEYLDIDDVGKPDSQMDAAASTDIVRKFNKMFAYNPRHSKNFEFEGTAGEEELDEDYDENNDEEEDYSLIAGSNGMDSDSRNYRGNERLQDSFHLEDSLYSKPVSYERPGTIFDQVQYRNPKSEDLLNPNTRYIGLTDVNDDINLFGDSSSVLRKVNENSNNFGESLMKNLNRYNYDETWKEMKDRDLSRISGSGFESDSNSKIDKRKINWRTKSKRNPLSEIRNRFFYASQTTDYDTKDLNDRINEGTQSKTGRSVYYRLPKRNPMNAELRGAENEFEYESEGNGKHFTGNLLNGGKDNSDNHDTTKLESSNEDKMNEGDEEDGGTNKRNSENSENVDDVKENLEDGGETMAEDNIMENVIGKYIMRKSVKAGALSRFNGRDEKKLSEDPIRHNLRKRSLEDILGEEHFPEVKVLRKRLSSGHLTESNFRKYHKKNPNKRNLKDLDKNADTTTNDIVKEDGAGDVSEENDKENSDKKQEKLSTDENEVKRSALDIFKKITNKDKDAKKSDDLNIRTAGFEPILSSSEQNLPSLSKEENKDGYIKSLKKNGDLDSKLLSESNENCAENKKVEKLDDNTHKVFSDGPWRIELKEKDNSKLSITPGKNSEKKFKSSMMTKDRLIPIKTKQEFKTHIASNKNVNAAERDSESEKATALNSRKSQREAENSFLAKAKQDARLSERDIWKRSLKSSDKVQDTVENPLKASNGISTAATENSVCPVDINKASHDTRSLSEDDNARAPQTINSGFANVETKLRQSEGKRKFFSNNGSNSGKSLFPIPNDANIIGDNRHLNEETSKYLGQQIVDAILAQATTDPRFKKLIAPGLTVKVPHTRRRTEDDGESLHHKDFSDKVQTLMQTVMSDLEKLAERHVKKRMCNQIDGQSKQFLHFLLDVPADKITQTRQIKDKIRSIPNIFTHEGLVPDKSFSNMVEGSTQGTPTSNESKKPTQADQSEASNQSEDEKPAMSEKDAIFLMKKKVLLSQLLKNYQYLKDTEGSEEYGEKVRAIENELDATNKELAYNEASVGRCQKKKKKPPKCPCSNPAPNPPCPPSPSPSCPPAPPSCPPAPPAPSPPPPSCPSPMDSFPANTDSDKGSQCLEVEQKKPPANECQEGTSETTTKAPADCYQFDPLIPLNITIQRPFPGLESGPRTGFELVKTTQKQTDSEENSTDKQTDTEEKPTNEQTDTKEKPTDIPKDFRNFNTTPPDDRLKYTKVFNVSSLVIQQSLPKYPPTDFPPLPGDKIEPEHSLGVNLPFNFGTPPANNFDWTKGGQTPMPSLPDIGYTVPMFDRNPIGSTPRPHFTVSPTKVNSHITLNNYNNGQVPNHNQFMYKEYLEDAFFRRNFYDKNVIPTDKDDDSTSRRISRGDNMVGKNRRSSRNTKNKWLSLRDFRQDDNTGEEKRKIRELRTWWRPNTQKQNQRTYLAQNRNEDYEEENPGMEYLVWSSMPAVRRRLNNMEPVIDLDRISWPRLRRRNLPEDGEEQGRQPGSV